MIAKSDDSIPFELARDAAVVYWLKKRSKHPKMAMTIWVILLEHLSSYVMPDTGEHRSQIMLTRGEISKKLQIPSKHVSQVMEELTSIGAIFLRQEGDREGKSRGTLRYFMNQAIVRPGA